MQNTPQRNTRDNSVFLEPIFFETPRIKRFYERNSDLSDERFHRNSHMIFTLMESPADPFSLAKKNLIMLRGNDFFSEGAEFTPLADEILDRKDPIFPSSKQMEAIRLTYPRDGEQESVQPEKCEISGTLQQYADFMKTSNADEYHHEEYNQNGSERLAAAQAERSGSQATTQGAAENCLLDEYRQTHIEYPAPSRKHSSNTIMNVERNGEEDVKHHKRHYFTPVQETNPSSHYKDLTVKDMNTNLNECLALAKRFSAVGNEKDDEIHSKTKYLTPVQKSTGTAKTNSGKEFEHENDRSTTVGSQLKSEGISENDDHEHEIEHEEEQVSKFSRYDKHAIKFGLNARSNGEVRKRKRKSIQQLKQLKLEYDWDDNWDKQRITKISEITGLSESQVYKWCWDQKKKADLPLEMDSKPKLEIFDDKENIYPKMNSSLNQQSKGISKAKNRPKDLRLAKTRREVKIMSPMYYGDIEQQYKEHH